MIGVEGLHQRAGSQTVIELHGNIHRLKCARNYHQIDMPIQAQLASCPYCDSLLRPDVVWFSESLPVEALQYAITAIKHSQTVLSVGTSNSVQPAASLPFAALNQGATVVEINPQLTPLTPHAHFVLQGAAGDYLPE